MADMKEVYDDLVVINLYTIFNYFTGSAAGLIHHNHQTGQDNSSNLDGNIKNSGNGSDNITAENETDNATADESSNGPIKVSTYCKGIFLSEDADVFVITPNRRTFFLTETENLNFGD